MDDALRPMTVGFVGLGQIGLPVAARAVAAGHLVRAYDLRDEPVMQLARLGAVAATGFADAAADSDIVAVCVVDDEQVRTLVNGAEEGGLLDVMRPGSVLVLHSTIQPETCEAIARACEPRCIDLLEVTLSGFPDRAAEGALTLMIAGDSAVVARCKPYLDAIGAQQFHLGVIGSAATAKLANNTMWKVCLVGTFEALALARSAGLDIDTMIDVARASTGNSEALRRWRSDRMTHESHPGFYAGGVTLGRDRILEDALSVATGHGQNLAVVQRLLELAAGVPAGQGGVQRYGVHDDVID